MEGDAPQPFICLGSRAVVVPALGPWQPGTLQLLHLLFPGQGSLCTTREEGVGARMCSVLSIWSGFLRALSIEHSCCAGELCWRNGSVRMGLYLYRAARAVVLFPSGPAVAIVQSLETAA